MNRSEGFTLIELVVVVFLIGSFLFIALPKFQDITEVNIKSASRSLSSTIRFLYNEAAFKKSVYRLRFDIENNQYWVEALNGTEFITPPDPEFRRRKLPTGVKFRDVITERSIRSGIEGDGEEFIIFLPTGYVEPAVIYLETENEDYYTIATKPYTGGTRIYDKYTELLQE